MGFGQEQEFYYSHGTGTSSPSQKAGRGISAETCGLDDEFDPGDLGSGLYTL